MLPESTRSWIERQVDDDLDRLFARPEDERRLYTVVDRNMSDEARERVREYLVRAYVRIYEAGGNAMALKIARERPVNLVADNAPHRGILPA